MSLLRVLQAAHSYRPEISGIAEVVTRVSELLAARGHEVDVATKLLPGIPAEEMMHGVRVHRFDIQGNRATGLRGDVAGFESFLQKGEWDVVVLHCAHSWSTDIALQGIERLNAGRVYVGHGLHLNDPKYSEWLAERLRLVDRIVCISPSMPEVEYAKHNGLERPTIIRNGVDLAEWDGPSRELRGRWRISGRPWIVNVSNHNPLKGHDTFFELTSALRARSKDLIATLIGNSYPAARWGLGRAGIRGGCWYQCRARSLGQPAVWLRHDLSRPDTVSAVREADLFVLTSVWEGSPLVLIEAMAAGTPWVALDVGSVGDNAGGIVVKSRDELVDVSLALLEDRNRRLALSAEGRARAGAQDWNVVTSDYERVLTAAAARGAVRPHKTQGVTPKGVR